MADLHDACVGSSVDDARRCLDRGDDIEETDGDGVTPLFRTCETGQVGIATLLLDRGAACDATNDNGAHPLHIAVEHDYAELVTLLLDRGAAVDATNGNSRSRSSTITQSWRRYCLTAEPTWTERTRTAVRRSTSRAKGKTASPPQRSFSTAARRSTRPRETARRRCTSRAFGATSKMSRLLLDRGADVNRTDEYERTPLHAAARWGHTSVARLCLEHGAA
mmetsp:Transcript_13279/g.41025  ORF Transcript_13279/g.41025 Transcript_13279/m.41025 type:complete len:221 (+) Transcript_13279:74-736(+)